MRQEQGQKNHVSNKKGAPKRIRVSSLRHSISVRPANLVEKAGLKKIVDSIIDKMLVCEDGRHRGEFIAPHKTEKGWNNILTFLHRDEALNHVKHGVFRGL